VIVGGGYSTGLILSNTGSIAATGNLIFTDQNGNPLLVSLTDPSSPPVQSSSSPGVAAIGSTFPVSVPPAGTRIFRAESLDSSDPLRIGSARLEVAAGFLNGVTLLEFTQENLPNRIAALFGSRPLNVATIPVDHDDSQNRFAGFSVANPSNEDIHIKLYVLDESGTVTETLDPPELNPLAPFRQVARFLHEYVTARLSFKGSMVLVGQGGKTFAVVALAQSQGLVTVVPVIPSKAPQVP
jgi:hypothetical protein